MDDPMTSQRRALFPFRGFGLKRLLQLQQLPQFPQFPQRGCTRFAQLYRGAWFGRCRYYAREDEIVEAARITMFTHREQTAHMVQCRHPTSPHRPTRPLAPLRPLCASRPLAPHRPPAAPNSPPTRP